MKLKIDRKNIMALLSKTQNIAEKKATMPVLINTLLKAEKNKLKVFATDLEVSLKDEAESEVESEGEIAVNTKQLFEIIRELDEGEISMEVVSEDEKSPSRLRVEQEKAVFNIVYVESSKYPVFPTFKTGNFIELDKQVFTEMIDRTIYCVSNDETRYHLNGVFFEKIEIHGKSHFRMVSTDSHRLSLVDRSMDTGNLEFGVIVPRKGLIELRKIVDFSNEPVFVSIEGSQLILKTGNILLMIRLIEGKYPDYMRFIPEDISEGREKALLIDREPFLSFIRRVSLLSDQKSKEITFKFLKDKMEMVSNDPELGDAREELDIEYSGDKFKIGFNAKYIMDVLNSFSEEKFKMYLKDEASPGVIRPEKDMNYTHVIMPIRL